MPRREHKRTSIVISGWLYHNTGAIRLETPEWWEWLKSASTFYFECSEGTFTARCESRSPKGSYWFAYRRVRTKLHNRYIGKSESLTMARLVEIARQLDEKMRGNDV